MDRIYRIDHSNTYSFNAPTLVTSASHKIKTKMRYSMSKDTAFNGETTLRRTFLCSDLQCLPPGDPITGKSFVAANIFFVKQMVF